MKGKWSWKAKPNRRCEPLLLPPFVHIKRSVPSQSFPPLRRWNLLLQVCWSNERPGEGQRMQWSRKPVLKRTRKVYDSCAPEIVWHCPGWAITGGMAVTRTTPHKLAWHLTLCSWSFFRRDFMLMPDYALTKLKFKSSFLLNNKIQSLVSIFSDRWLLWIELRWFLPTKAKSLSLRNAAAAQANSQGDCRKTMLFIKWQNISIWYWQGIFRLSSK